MRIVLVILAISAMAFVVACGDDDDATCTSGCQDTIAADCDNGPSSQTACETDCTNALNGNCGTEYQSLLNCADGKSVTCDASGIPQISGCDSQMTAFTNCLNP